MTLGEILRKLLDERDITQKQLAENLNISTSTISNYFQDNREPDYKTLKSIADYFNVTTDYLLDHKVDKTNSRREDDVLRVFRALKKDQQELYIDQGKVFLTHNIKKNKTAMRKIAEKKPRY